MTNTNQSTTQPTEQEKELQAISNAAYDKAIDDGCSEEEAEAISNQAYDNAEEKETKMTHSIPTNKFHALIMQQEAEHEIRRRNTPPFYHFILYTGTKRSPTKLEYQSGKFNTLKELQAGYAKWVKKHDYENESNNWFPIFYFVENGEGTAL